MSAEGFRRFATWDTAGTSPLYAALAEQVAEDAALLAIFEAAGDRQMNMPLCFAAVQRVLADHPDDPLAAYYLSFDGDRAPDAELAKTFEAFVLSHRERIGALLGTGETQSNEPLRAAQLRPAFGWAQAGFGRPLGLIEVGTSAGLLLHPEHYTYEYEFGDGSVLERRAVDDKFDDGPEIVLRCPIRGAATAKSLAPFVTKDLRISSRVGLDLRPLNPADAETRAWLRALLWPEEADRRARLDAALAMAARHPVRLRQGNALDILGAAVGMVTAPALPCVFVSNTLAHFPAETRTAFFDLVRELGSRQDLVLLMKEGDPSTPGVESLDALLYQSGRERRASLGTAGSHGAWLDWAPTML